MIKNLVYLPHMLCLHVQRSRI